MLCRLSHVLGIQDADRDSSFFSRSKYIALSQSMREVLPLMWLLEEAKQRGMKINAKFIAKYLKTTKEQLISLK